MSRVIITLPDDLLESIDSQARKAHKSRSALMRSALADWMAAKERAEFEQLLADGYKEMAASPAEFAEDFAGVQAEALQATWRWDD